MEAVFSLSPTKEEERVAHLGRMSTGKKMSPSTFLSRAFWLPQDILKPRPNLSFPSL